MKCTKCETEINPMKEPTIQIRVEYPYGPTFHKVWCFDCYKEARGY